MPSTEGILQPMITVLLDLPRSFMRHFRAFRQYTGNHMFALIALTTLMSYAEGIGIALFFPLLKSDGADDALSQTLNRVMRALHVAPTPTGALPFIVAAFVLKGILQLGTNSYQGYLAAQLTLRLRRRIVSGLRRLDYRAVTSTNTGFISNLLVNEVTKVGFAFTYFVRCFPSAISVIAFFGIVTWLNWRLTLFCVLMGLCAVAVLGFTGRIAARASQVQTRENGLLTSLLVQMVQAFKYLRATGRFDRFEEKIVASAERSARADTRMYATIALSAAVAQPLVVIFLAALLYYRSAVQHQPFGSLFILLLYFFRIMSELWVLQNTWQQVIGYHGQIEVVYSWVDKLAHGSEPNGTRAYDPSSSEIELRDVSFAYLPERPVLRGVHLRVAANSTVAFVGESGAGKSTLVDLILGTLKPTGGAISIGGTSVADLDLETLRRRVGYVPQDAMLFDDTVANNISLWEPASEQQIIDAAQRAKCLEFIETMPQKLASPIGDRGIKLSGGQRQRLAIARELFKHPTILVLDEATSALDSESERAIQQSIDSLEGQMTILIIAHRLSTIRNCDHICVLHEGRIVEEGSYDELLSRRGSRFERLCQLQELTREADPAPKTGVS
jgi:ABC-type multidrug transport system fused ATPase/permease subunit